MKQGQIIELLLKVLPPVASTIEKIDLGDRIGSGVVEFSWRSERYAIDADLHVFLCDGESITSNNASYLLERLLGLCNAHIFPVESFEEAIDNE